MTHILYMKRHGRLEYEEMHLTRVNSTSVNSKGSINLQIRVQIRVKKGRGGGWTECRGFMRKTMPAWFSQGSQKGRISHVAIELYPIQLHRLRGGIKRSSALSYISSE